MTRKYTIKYQKKFPFYEWIDVDKEVIVLNHNGKIEVIDSICPHFGGRLEIYKSGLNKLICPFHGIKFNITDCTSDNKIFKKIKKYKIISRDPLIIED